MIFPPLPSATSTLFFVFAISSRLRWFMGNATPISLRDINRYRHGEEPRQARVGTLALKKASSPSQKIERSFHLGILIAVFHLLYFLELGISSDEKGKLGTGQNSNTKPEGNASRVHFYAFASVFPADKNFKVSLDACISKNQLNCDFRIRHINFCLPVSFHFFWNIVTALSKQGTDLCLFLSLRSIAIPISWNAILSSFRAFFSDLSKETLNAPVAT